MTSSGARGGDIRIMSFILTHGVTATRPTIDDIDVIPGTGNTGLVATAAEHFTGRARLRSGPASVRRQSLVEDSREACVLHGGFAPTPGRRQSFHGEVSAKTWVPVLALAPDGAPVRYESSRLLVCSV